AINGYDKWLSYYSRTYVRFSFSYTSNIDVMLILNMSCVYAYIMNGLTVINAPCQSLFLLLFQQ
ncbi:hypothetical protein, partial [Bacillus altitudinis]|uniref:hypothetical protein n=1 Tax=Bacillus altitudinis TaxID=293387 RepID=UPI0024ACD4B2